MHINRWVREDVTKTVADVLASKVWFSIRNTAKINMIPTVGPPPVGAGRLVPFENMVHLNDIY